MSGGEQQESAAGSSALPCLSPHSEPVRGTPSPARLGPCPPRHRLGEPELTAAAEPRGGRGAPVAAAPVPAALRTCPVQQAQTPGPGRSCPVPSPPVPVPSPTAPGTYV